jgi:hypothetical protein
MKLVGFGTHWPPLCQLRDRCALRRRGGSGPNADWAALDSLCTVYGCDDTTSLAHPSACLPAHVHDGRLEASERQPGPGFRSLRSSSNTICPNTAPATQTPSQCCVRWLGHRFWWYYQDATGALGLPARLAAFKP